MNRKLLLLASVVLMLSSAVYAHTTSTNGTQSATVIEKLTDLKDNLKDTAKTGIEKFSEKASDIYQSLSTQIDEILYNLKDQKDAKIISLKQKRDELKKELDSYNKTESTKTEIMRSNLVKKLEELNEKISDYNKSLKK